MFRFTSCLFFALSAMLICAPISVTRSDAITIFSVAAAADADNSIIQAGAEADDDIDVDDNDEDDDEDYGDDDDGDDEDEDDSPLDDEDEDPADSDDSSPPEPNKPAVIDPPGDENAKYTAPKASGALFFEDFQSGLSKWTASEESDYNGEFKVGQGAKPTFRGDRALIIPEKARKYGLSTKVDGLSNLSGKDFVVQYELKLEEGVSCGGAYIKLPLEGFEPKQLKGETPYSIMFGPDKCGATDKVHFIFQSKNPVTKKFVEHHLKNPPTIANSYDKKTHLYTLIVRKDASFELHVDMEKKSYGSLSEKFTPAVQPEQEIDDPEDKKPKEWVDEKKIADPDAKKPDDWDEDAPKQISDEEAVKPEGWLDDEPEMIPDPEAKKPDEWDDEEDGQWDAPKVTNPKCEAVGCGEWKKPMKDNPDYKGKWKAPMIDNPKYIGEWSPRKITNPDYYKVEDMGLLGIAGVAFEIWTMDQGVLFDNLYIGTDVEAAEKYANSTFRVKQKTELDQEEKERAEEDRKADKAKKKGSMDRSTKLGKTLGPVMDKVEDLIEKLDAALAPAEAWLQKQGLEPYLDKLIDMGIQKPMIVIVSVPLVITLLLFVLLGGKKSADEEESTVTETADEPEPAETTDKKKTDGETEDVIEKEVTEAEDIDVGSQQNGIESTGLRQRNVPADS